MALLEGLFNSCMFERTCRKIVELWFDSIVARVAASMFKTNHCTLSNICLLSKLPQKQVERALLILIQHNLVAFKPSSNGQPVYKLLKSHVFYSLRKIKYLMHVRAALGVQAELVLDKVLEEGCATVSQIIVATSCRLACSSAAADKSPTTASGSSGAPDYQLTVRDAVRQLLEGQYLQRCPPAMPQSASPVYTCPRFQQLQQEEDDLEDTSSKHRFPSELLDLKLTKEEFERRMSDDSLSVDGRTGLPPRSSFPDAEHVWKINYDAFHLQWRDELLTKVVSDRLSREGGDAFRAMLAAAYQDVPDKWRTAVFTTSAHVHAHYTKQRRAEAAAGGAACATTSVNGSNGGGGAGGDNQLDQCIALLESECGGCVRRVGVGASGGEYNVDVAAYVAQIMQEFCAKIITDKFGSKAARIFRLVLRDHIVSADMIAQSCLLDKKEAYELSNKLLLHKYLRVHDLKKPSMPSTASRDQLFFGINFLEVVTLTGGQCFAAIHNLLRKREILAEANKSLVEKKTRMDAIISNMEKHSVPEEQINEVREMMSPADLAAVTKWKREQDTLLTVITNISRHDMLLVELYLRYFPHMDYITTGRRINPPA